MKEDAITVWRHSNRVMLIEAFGGTEVLPP